MSLLLRQQATDEMQYCESDTDSLFSNKTDTLGLQVLGAESGLAVCVICQRSKTQVAAEGFEAISLATEATFM